MKVLQILPELESGGVERGTLELAKYLVGRGDEALVVSNGGRLVDELESSGCRHIQLPVHKKSLSSLTQVKVMRKLLESEQPDIVHLRSRVPAWITYLAWRKMDPASRPRLVSTVHGFYSVNAYSKIMTCGERVIAVSDSVKEYILMNYPKTQPELIRVVHRGVDPTDYQFGHLPEKSWRHQWYADFPETKGKVLLTLPGRITRLKGHSDFLQILTQLKKRHSAVHGVIAGGAHPRKQAYLDELKQMVAQAGLSESVTFTGHRSDLREILAMSDVVLSLTSQPESFGRTTLEALCLGTPVLGYEHGGVGEILSAIFPAGKCASGDAKKAAQMIDGWLINGMPALEEKNPFTLERMLSQTVEVYNELLA